MATSAIIHRTLPPQALTPAPAMTLPDGDAESFSAALEAEMEYLIGSKGEQVAWDYFERKELVALANQPPRAPEITDDDLHDEEHDLTAEDTEPDGTSPQKAEQEFSFWDALDVINPLQHIPGVNLLYRELTGDEIKPAARIAGGALFGGGLGLVAAIGDSMLEEISGRTAGGHAMALLTGDDDKPAPSPTMLANREKLYQSGPDGDLTAPTSTASDIDETI